MSERDYEAEAKEQGWNPDYDGPNKRSAQEFVEKGDQIAGILKSKVDRLERNVASLTNSNREFGEYHKKIIDSERRKNAERISELQSQIGQSITDGDGQAYKRLNGEIEEIRRLEEPAQSDADAWNTLSQGWAAENQWYATNSKLATYADGVSDQIRAQGYTGPAYFAELTRRVKEDNPEEFKNPKKTTPQGVEDEGGDSGSSKGTKTFKDLPADAKAQCKEFVADGFMTTADYVSQYEFDD